MKPADQIVARARQILRDGERYPVNWDAEIIRADERIAFAQLINISHSGVAFHSDTALNLGEQYWMAIRGLGEYGLTIVRRFGAVDFAGHFDINFQGKTRLEARIRERLAAAGN